MDIQLTLYEQPLVKTNDAVQYIHYNKYILNNTSFTFSMRQHTAERDSAKENN